MNSRRNFLRTAAAGVLALNFPNVTNVLAATPPTWTKASGPRVLVDWHSHFVTKAEIAYFKARNLPPHLFTDADGKQLFQNVTTVSAAAGQPSEFTPSDIKTRIEHLNENEIAKQLLTHTVALGLDATLPVEELRPLFRSINNELAEVVRQHPDRFLAVAAIPTADPVWAAEELTRAHKELGLIGGSLPLNAFTTLAGAKTLAPIFEAGQTLRSHFFIHRGPASAKVPGQPPLIVPEDSGFARWSLISNTHLTSGGITLGLTDFLDPYPDVAVQIIMLAGFLPYLTESLVPAAQRAGIKDPLARLRRLYLDPGPYSRNGEWVVQAAKKIGADRILFGTDYGVGGGTRGDVAPAFASLDLALDPEQRRLIYVDNSAQLLKSKGLL